MQKTLSLPKAVVASTDESAENPYLFMEKDQMVAAAKKKSFAVAKKK